MNVGLDTSVVVRVLAGHPEDLALAALRFLQERQRAGDVVLVSDLVLAETYHAFQHHYGASKRDTLDALRAFLATPGVEGPGVAKEQLSTRGLESAKPGFVDRIIHRDYLRAGAEQVATFESASAKLPRVAVLTV